MIFHANSATINNGSSGISFQSPFSSHSKVVLKFAQGRQKGVLNEFWADFERVK